MESAQARKAWTGDQPGVVLQEVEFRRLGRFVEGHCGIRMPPGKRIMVESRLRKRLRVLGMESFRTYCEFVFSARGEGERIQLVDALTTNKTDFFREPSHFGCLVKSALPELVRSSGAGMRRPLTVWSAACSTGEEPYTLAMVLSEVAQSLPGFRFQVLATDISTNALEHAQRAVYSEERIAPVPMGLRRTYLLRSRDSNRALVRMSPELRACVRFRHLNLLDDGFGFRERIDVIFCRNVMIYFDRPTQEAALNRLCRHLVPGGYLFLGHSESIHGLRVPLRSVEPTVYRLTESRCGS